MKSKNIFLVGIKGVAMANLAVILKKMGKTVAGSDVAEEFITDETLKKHDIRVAVGFEGPLPEGIDLVIYTGAHGGIENPLVMEAKKRGIQVQPQIVVMAELFKAAKTKIAVAGSHGKTTTASLVVYALIKLGKQVSYMVGAPHFNEFEGGDYNGTDYFVIEADEYAVNPPMDKTPKFLSLSPDYILLTNIDFDHPDVFANLGEITQAFEQFFKRSKKVIKCEESTISNVRTTIEGTQFTISDGGNVHQFHIGLYGGKNAMNAAGAVRLLHELGFEWVQIATAIKDFKGAKRRFEKKGEVRGVLLMDDYAHHPKEIEATIEAARATFPGRRLIVIFEPHTYSRTQALVTEFGSTLAKADFAFVAPIFASAREDPKEFHVSSQDIAKSAPSGSKVEALATKQAILGRLASIIAPGDVIFTMGAGDIYKLKSGIISTIENAIGTN